MCRSLKLTRLSNIVLITFAILMAQAYAQPPDSISLKKLPSGLDPIESMPLIPIEPIPLPSKPMSLGCSNTTTCLDVSNFLWSKKVTIGGSHSPLHLATPYELEVNGTILAKEVIVQSNWPDYVFGDDYSLLSLDDLDKYVHQQRHLPGIPTADEVRSRGVSIGEIQVSLLEKIEELKLHLIAQQKTIKQLNERIVQIEREIR